MTEQRFEKVVEQNSLTPLTLIGIGFFLFSLGFFLFYNFSYDDILPVSFMLMGLTIFLIDLIMSRKVYYRRIK